MIRSLLSYTPLDPGVQWMSCQCLCMKRGYRLHQVTDRVHGRVGHVCSTWDTHLTVALSLLEKRSVHLNASHQCLKTNQSSEEPTESVLRWVNKFIYPYAELESRFFAPIIVSRTSDRFFQMLASNIKKRKDHRRDRLDRFFDGSKKSFLMQKIEFRFFAPIIGSSEHPIGSSKC